MANISEWDSEVSKIESKPSRAELDDDVGENRRARHYVVYRHVLVRCVRDAGIARPVLDGWNAALAHEQPKV
jgi:hypothetical protein